MAERLLSHIAHRDIPPELIGVDIAHLIYRTYENAGAIAAVPAQ
ncbi:unnamed protein product [marine sediment metagenome]|uniref:Uncharacterized protein n=1 Tax=marine sediment metagenome TaxID=412755 RepID=X0U4U4_9ZZZZ